MKTKVFSVLLLVLLLSEAGNTQPLQPGFDKEQFTELLKISARTTADSAYYNTLPAPEHFIKVYHSPSMGLDNFWDLWVNKKEEMVISIRGTTQNSASWLANFYAAMVPAKGELQISQNEKWKYELASDPKAAVHTGWLVSTAFLSKDILPKIDSSYKKGIKNIIIMGHSQGGAVAYLLTAYLYNLQKQNLLPADIRSKTYCSAGPKPGNLYFAYEYEAMTQNGWAYNVVNSADWVPNVVLRHVYNRLDKPSRRAQRRYQRILGKHTSKMIKKQIEGFVPPQYYNSNDYVRTGNTIVLHADEEYFKVFPQTSDKIFTHHFHKPYLYLLEKLDLK